MRRTSDRREPPIGGVFPLESVTSALVTGASLWEHWSGGRATVYGFHNARSALRYVLDSIRPRRLWVPFYACREILQATAGMAHRLQFYPIGSDLRPKVDVLADQLRAGDGVLGINYFGRPAAPDWRALAHATPSVFWIEDSAQSVDAGGDFADVIIHSPRKLLGVPDGGILVDVRGVLPAPILRSGSSARFLYPYLLRQRDRVGDNNDLWFAAFRRAEAAMTPDNCAVSALSDSILKATSFASISEPRKANFAMLHNALADVALFDEPSPEWTPLGFPVRVRRAHEFAARLAQQRIFAPRHWQRIGSAEPPPIERKLSETLVTLPCDQRYNREDMERTVEAARGALS